MRIRTSTTSEYLWYRVLVVQYRYLQYEYSTGTSTRYCEKVRSTKLSKFLTLETPHLSL